MRALIGVDFQYDFMFGTLGAEDRYSAIAPWLEHTKVAGLVIATKDWHHKKHCSFIKQGGDYPVHCVMGTLGATLDPEVEAASNFVICKGMDRDKEQFSAWTPGMENLLKTHNATSLEIGGLLLDICVKFTAMGAVASGWDVTVLDSATRASSPEAAEATWAEFAALGIKRGS